MTRTTLAANLLSLALWAIGCSPNKPESSGTNTNWLIACDSIEQCAPRGSCICGICSRECASDAECGPGICGSQLATAVQCGGAQTQAICLPAPTDVGSCSSFLIPADADLALTAPAPAPCSAPGALLCESFDAPLRADYATFYAGQMTASVEDCLVHQGAGALRYRAPGPGYSQTRMRLASPVASGVLAARFYLYVPSSMTIPDYLAFFELWPNEDTSDGKISVEAKPNDVVEVYLTPNGTAYASAAGVLRRDRWSCISLSLNVAAMGGSMTLSVDGKTVIEASSVVTRPPTPISVAVVEGLPSSEAAGAELLIDDLMVGTEPLACP